MTAPGDIHIRNNRKTTAFTNGDAPTSIGSQYLELPPRPVLAVFCLDHFRVELDGVPLDTSRGGKAVSLLKYMVGSRKALNSRHALSETLWPDCGPEIVANRLRVAIHSLRRLLDPKGCFPDLIVHQAGGYRLNPQGAVWVDSDAFEEGWERGVRLERSGKLREACRAFEEAEALYVRDYLDDDPYEQWALLRRESLKDAYMIIVERLAEWSIAMRDYDSCILRCQKLLDRDDCHESAYRLLMLSHLRLGQRLRAMQWFRICELVLDRELALRPLPETQVIYEQVLRSE